MNKTYSFFYDFPENKIPIWEELKISLMGKNLTNKSLLEKLVNYYLEI